MPVARRRAALPAARDEQHPDPGGVAKAIALWSNRGRRIDATMPSLFRFLVLLALIGGVVYGVVYALATFVKPVTRPMVTVVPLKAPPPAPTP